MPQIIELDCPPGNPRPGDLIADVVKGTPLEGKLGDTVSRSFGCWTWAFPDVSEFEWKLAQKTIGPRVEALYNAGKIRYGSW